MAFCTSCGKEILEGATFCVHCGTAVTADTPAAPIAAEPPVAPVAPVAPEAPAAQEIPVMPAYTAEEQEFLTWTYRLMTWERKARHIEGKVYLIMGIVFAVCFFLMALIFDTPVSSEFQMVGEMMSAIFITYSIIYGGMIVALGIIQKVAVKKLDPYIAGFDADCQPALTRCGSVGMLVFSIIFGAVSMVFFLINFIRIKANGRLIEQIKARQQ